MTRPLIENQVMAGTRWAAGGSVAADWSASKSADRPGVRAVERTDESHHLLVVRDVVAALLQIDRGMEEALVADRDETGLDEGQRQGLRPVSRPGLADDNRLSL